jgi:hypothetical protein
LNVLTFDNTREVHVGEVIDLPFLELVGLSADFGERRELRSILRLKNRQEIREVFTIALNVVSGCNSHLAE